MRDLKGWLRRLEREAAGEMIVVDLVDGSTVRFPEAAGREAFLNLLNGKDHPLAEAVRSSDDPRWEQSLYNSVPLDRAAIEDLSE